MTTLLLKGHHCLGSRPLLQSGNERSPSMRHAMFGLNPIEIVVVVVAVAVLLCWQIRRDIRDRRKIRAASSHDPHP